MNGSVMYVCYVNKSFHIYLTLKIMLHNWFSNGVQCSAWKIFSFIMYYSERDDYDTRARGVIQQGPCPCYCTAYIVR